jgi:hypothetical protein
VVVLDALDERGADLGPDRLEVAVGARARGGQFFEAGLLLRNMAQGPGGLDGEDPGVW